MSEAIAGSRPTHAEQPRDMQSPTRPEGQIAQQLRWAIRPIQHLLNDPKITDIHINGAGWNGVTPVFIKRAGQRERTEVNLTALQLEQIGANAAVLGGGQVTQRMPFSPGKLPDKQRVNIACWPAVPEGSYGISIRTRFKRAMTPQELRDMGVFDDTEPSETAPPRAGTDEMLGLKAARKWMEFIEAGYRYGYNGVFAGPMNSGKSTNLLAFYHAASRTRRILTVQDTEELEDIPQQDVVHFLYPKDTGGIAQHTSENCIEAGLRIDIDEVVNGEIRDGAAWALLRAGSAGITFKTSLHAPSAEGAFPALYRMAKQHPVARTFEKDDIMQTLFELIDFVVFSDVVDGKRKVTQIWFDPSVKRGALPKNIKAKLLEGNGAVE